MITLCIQTGEDPLKVHDHNRSDKTHLMKEKRKNMTTDREKSERPMVMFQPRQQQPTLEKIIQRNSMADIFEQF